MGFQTPPDRRAVMTVTTDGYETISQERAGDLFNFFASDFKLSSDR